MRITRVAKIRGHRVFRDFAWPNDTPAEVPTCDDFEVTK
jgi:hypothetical protein